MTEPPSAYELLCRHADHHGWKVRLGIISPPHMASKRQALRPGQRELGHSVVCELGLLCRSGFRLVDATPFLGPAGIEKAAGEILCLLEREGALP